MVSTSPCPTTKAISCQEELNSPPCPSQQQCANTRKGTQTKYNSERSWPASPQEPFHCSNSNQIQDKECKRQRLIIDYHLKFVQRETLPPQKQEGDTTHINTQEVQQRRSCFKKPLPNHLGYVEEALPHTVVPKRAACPPQKQQRTTRRGLQSKGGS